MPRRLLLLLFVLSAACTRLHAQSLYHFTYTFTNRGKKEFYNSFMVRYEDGTGFIRVKYKDVVSGKQYLVNMDMLEDYDVDDKTGDTDSSVLYFTGGNPVVISGDTADSYDPDTYVFQKSDTSAYYEPMAVTSQADDGTITTGELTEVNLIDSHELTEDFVLQYFSKDDDFYKSLFTASVRQLTNVEKTTTLHLIIVANTNDPDIGTTCMLDKDRTLKTFSDLSEYMGVKLDAKTIFGNDYNIKNVQDAIASLQASPRDIVIFYYSGHGFSKDDNRQFPYVELRSKSFQTLDDNSMNIEDIYNSLNQKKANLTLVISDCCNTLPEIPEAVSGDVAATRSSSLGWNLNNCLQLFMPTSRISILMTAASKGEMSAGNNNYGGFFTSNFRAALVNYLSPVFVSNDATWPKLIEEAKNQTVKKAEHTLCNLPNGGHAVCTQHPVYKVF